jgi:hypothetical protein
MDEHEPIRTVADLRAALQDLPEEAPVRWAHQPRWAMEYAIDGVAQVDDLAGDGPVVYLVAGNQLGYLPEEAAEEIGW